MTIVLKFSKVKQISTNLGSFLQRYDFTETIKTAINATIGLLKAWRLVTGCTMAPALCELRQKRRPANNIEVNKYLNLQKMKRKKSASVQIKVTIRFESLVIATRIHLFYSVKHLQFRYVGLCQLTL